MAQDPAVSVKRKLKKTLATLLTTSADNLNIEN